MIGRGFSFGVGATAALAVGIGIGTPAAAQGRLTVDASLSGGVASNPSLEEGKSSLTGSATLSISPSYSIDTGLTQFNLRGDATITEYLERYPNSDSFAVSASGTHRLSGRSSLSTQLGYVNTVVGAFNDVGVAGTGIFVPGVTSAPLAAPDDPNTAIAPPIDPATLGIVSNLANDPSLGGIGQRRQSYSGGVAYSGGLGERDSVSLGLSLIASRAKSGALDDFNYVTQTVGYRRAIRQGLDITANLSIGHTDYLRQREGDATTFQPTVGTSYRIAEGTSLNLSVGVSLVRSSLLAVGTSRTSTSLSGQGSLCRQDSRWNACLSLSRSALPSAAQGVRVQTAASLSAGLRVSERDSFSASTSYSRSGAPLGFTTAPFLFSTRTEYLSVRGSYDRRLSQRLSGFVSAGAARVYGDQSAARAPSYEARVGVRIGFGRG